MKSIKLQVTTENFPFFLKRLFSSSLEDSPWDIRVILMKSCEFLFMVVFVVFFSLGGCGIRNYISAIDYRFLSLHVQFGTYECNSSYLKKA